MNTCFTWDFREKLGWGTDIACNNWIYCVDPELPNEKNGMDYSGLEEVQHVAPYQSLYENLEEEVHTIQESLQQVSWEVFLVVAFLNYYCYLYILK